MASSTVGVGADDLVTGEAVALDLPPAGLGLRICSGLIDLVVGLVALALTAQLAVLLAGGGEALLAAAGTLAVVVSLVVLPTALETLTRGKTLGHLAVGLRTVRDDAGPIRFRHALTRALVGAVEVYGLAGLPALGCAVFSRQGKRFGDVLAGTYVVRDRQQVSLPPPVQMPRELAGWAASADMAALPDHLALAIRQFLSRTGDLSPAPRAELGGRLLAEVRPFVAPPAPPGHHQEHVLAAVMAERRSRDAARLHRDEILRRRVLPPDPVGGS